MHVVVRADGGPDIGYGHLVRTGALAEELLTRGHDVTYATVTPGHVDEVCPEGISMVELDERANSSDLLDVVHGDVDVTVLDSYDANLGYQRAVRSETPVVVLSDDARHPVCADVLVNGNFYAERLEYEVAGPEPTWCLGPEYVLLRESVTRRAAREPPWRDPPERALVTMGGSDIANVTPDAVRAFDGVAVSLDVIVGPGFSNEDEIRSTTDAVDVNARLLRDPPNLAELMFEADLAVSTCGTTIYELLALGTPFVCCPVVDNQVRPAKELESRGLGIVINGDPNAEKFRQGVNAYMTNAETRRKQRRTGRSLVDGRGRDRLYDVITDLGANASAK